MSGSLHKKESSPWHKSRPGAAADVFVRRLKLEPDPNDPTLNRLCTV